MIMVNLVVSSEIRINERRTVGMMGTITGLVRTIRLLYADLVCDALGREGSMECKVAEDDVLIEASSVASDEEGEEEGEERESREGNFSLNRGNEGFLNQLAARCVLTRSNWRA